MSTSEVPFLTGTTLAARAGVVLAVPLSAALGATLLDEDDPPRGVRFTVGDLALNGAGGVHAAAVGAVLELSGYLALLPQLREDEHAVTHASSYQLLATVPEGSEIEVRAHLTDRTRRLAFVDAVATSGERVLARAQLTKSVVAWRAS